MKLFGRKKKDLPTIDLNRYEPVLRCSICSGEQVLCIRDRVSSDVHELMLVQSPAELEEVCEANGIDADSVKKIY